MRSSNLTTGSRLGINTHAIARRQSSRTVDGPPGDWSRSREYPAGYRVPPLYVGYPGFSVSLRVCIPACLPESNPSFRLNSILAIAWWIANYVRSPWKFTTEWIPSFWLLAVAPCIGRHCCRASTTGLWLYGFADVPMRLSRYSLIIRRWKYSTN